MTDRSKKADGEFSYYFPDYGEINNGGHTKAANLISAPSLVWHKAFWNPVNGAIAREERIKLIKGFIESVHKNIKDNVDTRIDEISNDIIESQDDRTNAVSFIFNWTGIQCRLRFEIHTEYLTVTAIADLSVKRSGVGGKMNVNVVSAFDNIIYLLNTGKPHKELETSREILYQKFWEEFDKEIVGNETYFQPVEGDGRDKKSPMLGFCFGDFRGVITTESYPTFWGKKSEDSEEAKRKFLKTKRWKVRSCFEKSNHHGQRGVWHRFGIPETSWARKRLTNAWRFLDASSGPKPVSSKEKTVSGKGRLEFTVSRILDGRMLFVTALGPQLSNKAGKPNQTQQPVEFWLHSATQSERQIGRAVGRICRGGTLRLASVLATPALLRIHNELSDIEELIRVARVNIRKLLTKENGVESVSISDQGDNQPLVENHDSTSDQGDNPSPVENDDSTVDAKNSREPDKKASPTSASVLTELGVLRKRYSKLLAGEPPSEDECLPPKEYKRRVKRFSKVSQLGEASLEYRLVRSRYYRKALFSLFKDLRIQRLESYQPYDDFVQRRLRSAYGFIDGLELRLNSVKEELKLLDQFHQTASMELLINEMGRQQDEMGDQQDKLVGYQESLNHIQFTAEILLLLLVAPYYLTNMAAYILDIKEPEPYFNGFGIEVSNKQFLAFAVWMVMALIAAFRRWHHKKENGSKG